MSTKSAPPIRHALGLPAGSIRSILAMLVVALVCGVMLIPSRNELLPPYLLYLLFLIVGHFFAALGAHAPPDHSRPLYVPRILVRLAIIAALGATVGWKLYTDQAGLASRWAESVELIKAQWFVPLWLLGGFFAGILFRAIVGRDNPSIVIQDFEAWLALIAVIGLCSAALIVLFINPRGTLALEKFEAGLATVIAFYFGARS